MNLTIEQLVVGGEIIKAALYVAQEIRGKDCLHDQINVATLALRNSGRFDNDAISQLVAYCVTKSAG